MDCPQDRSDLSTHSESESYMYHFNMYAQTGGLRLVQTPTKALKCEIRLTQKQRTSLIQHPKPQKTTKMSQSDDNVYHTNI